MTEFITGLGLDVFDIVNFLLVVLASVGIVTKMKPFMKIGKEGSEFLLVSVKALLDDNQVDKKERENIKKELADVKRELKNLKKKK